MDKAEYISKLEQIHTLAEAGSYPEAAEIADGIDWKHVKSVRTLCTIAEIYEADKRYDDSLRILKMAYRRSSSSKTVLYRLAENDIMTGNIDEAKKFINEFEQNSPNDTSRFILKYKLLRAENAPIDDQIAVLKEYQNHEYTERWSYELAKLYRKNGQNEKCIEECDDLILWFSEGKYVMKAMELKKQLAALTPSQQAKYEESLRKEAEEKEKAKAAAKKAKAKAAAAEKTGGQEEEAPAEEVPSVNTSAETEEPEGVAAETAESGDGTPEVTAEEVPEAQAEEETKGEAPLEAEESDAAAKSGEEAGEGEEDPGIPKLSSEEAIEKMDSAAGMTIGDRNVLEMQEANSGGRESGESFQSRLASGIRAVFASIRQTTSIDMDEPEADADDDMKIAGEPGGQIGYLVEEEPEAPAEEQKEMLVRDLEPESFDAGSVVKRLADVFGGKRNAASKDRTEEEIAGDEIDAVIRGEEPPKAIDLDKLFAETAGSLASEVASGQYKLADTMDSGEEETRVTDDPADFAEQVRAAAAAAGLTETAGGEAPAEVSEAAESAETAPEETVPPAEVPVPQEEEQVPAEETGADTPGEGLQEEELSIEDLAEAVKSAAEQAVKEAEGENAEAAPESADDALPEGEIPAEMPEEEVPAEAAEEGIPEEVPEEDFTGMPEEPAAGAGVDAGRSAEEQMISRETDESLGLTKEFHFQEEIEKALAERRSKKEEEQAERAVLRSPEEAADEQVSEAVGEDVPTVPQEESIPAFDGAFEVTPMAAVFADEDHGEEPETDEALIERYGTAVEAPAEDGSGETGQETVPDAAAEEEPLLSSPMAEVSAERFEPMSTEGRQFTAAEARAFSYFASVPGMDYQATAAIADIYNNSGDRTSRRGNLAISGRPGSGKTRLADALILSSCLAMDLKAVKVGRIVSDVFNKKDPAAIVKTLAGGFLVIEAAGALSPEAVTRLNKAMEFRTDSLVVILEDEKQDLDNLFAAHPDFAAKFTNHISVPIFTNDELVGFGKAYAEENGYRMDEMATLALYTMIGDKQKNAEPVTVSMVRDMVDKAADRSSRKFRFGKAPEKVDGLIVLHEKDFNF